MLPGDWHEFQPLIDEALDAPPDQRAALLLKLSGGDARRHARIESLVAECERDAPFLSRPAAERFASLFDDEPEPPPPDFLGGYRIEREIGRGGMARVYLADDLKHSRRVAVKVIRAELAASLGRDRFLREISIAARLRHPNIVPLYDSGDEAGMLYFVMPYEEGPSLRERLATGEPLTVEERFSTLRDVARALAYAHERGVVHRDIKPDNVMLSGGAAVVTDFGIAKAVTAAQGAGTSGIVTQSGSGIGTPAYMAPEQAIGDPSTDHRADIYSFGCLAYELFAGHPPFEGKAVHDVIAAHIQTQPVPIEEAGTDVSADVARLITRCLEKLPDARPQAAQELLPYLDTFRPKPLTAIRKLRSAAAMRGVAMAVVLLGVVGGYLGTRDQALPGIPASSLRAVAVLPLISVGGDSVQRDLADGLSDEIATALFRVPGVRVVSRRGAANYRGLRNLDPAKIGRELGVRFLVIGSLREESGRMIVLTQLVDAGDGTMLWSDRFDRTQAELGPVRDEIVRAVGDTLRRMFGVPARAAGSSGRASHAVNPEAYRLYVLAQRALDRRGQSIQASIDMFKRATEQDTLYAKAYSGLSMAVALSRYFAPVASRTVAEEATAAAQKALRLDPTLAQPHVALGLVYQHAYQWEHAAAEFRTAVALDSRDVEARVQYGRHLLFRDRPGEALAQFLVARSEDPASALVLSWVAYSYYVMGQLDSAYVESARAFQSDSTNTTTLLVGSLVRLKAGRPREALRFMERGQPFMETVFYVLAATGDTAGAMARLRTFERTMPRGWRTETNRAYAMLGAGDTARALSALERATDSNEIWPTLESTRDPIFDPIRNSPRFQRLLRRVGLL